MDRILTVGSDGAMKTSLETQSIFKTFSIGELRAYIKPINKDSFFVPELGGVFVPDLVDNTSLDDGYMCLVTQSGIRMKRQGYEVWAEDFGAKGGTHDDTDAINSAINYVYSLYGQGTVRFKPKTYSCTHIVGRPGVNLIGSDMYPNGLSVTESGTQFKCISETYIRLFYSVVADNSYTGQTGEKTGLYKSQPRQIVANIQFNADGMAKHCTAFEESWGFSLYRCKFHNALSYSLLIFDCNNFYVNKCDVKNLLFISNADFNVDGNEISGSSVLPALLCDRSSFGIISLNKIYYSPRAGSRTFNVVSVTGDTFEFDNITNLLTSNPEWATSGTANGSISESQTQVIFSGINKNSARFVTTRGSLSVGNNYNLTGTFLLSPSSTSNTRTITLMCGNETQTYATFTINKGEPYNLNLDFVFNPSGYKKTGPLKIVVSSVSSIVTDEIICESLFLKGLLSQELDETPLILDYQKDTLSAVNIDKLPHSEGYYIKFLSTSTFKLAKSLSDLKNEIYINLGNLVGLSGFSVSVPDTVLAMIGKLSADNIVSLNKIEDVESKGVLLVGAYNNTFSGNKLSKANYVDKAVLFDVTKGATKNIIDGCIINRRFEVTSLDKTTTSLRFDKYSGKNVIGVNQIGDSYQFDIEDNFEGTTDGQNLYSAIALENTFVKRKRATDLKSISKGIVFEKGSGSEVTSSTPIISENEFTIFWKNVIFFDNDGDVTLLRQVDLNVSGGQNGRINIKRIGSSKSIYITVNATVVFSTADNTIMPNVSYDIVVSKDEEGNWSLYLNGEFISKQLGALNISIPTSVGTKTTIGAVNGSKWSLERIRVFNDCLLEKEIYSLFSSNIICKNTNHNNKVIDSTLNGLSSFQNLSNAAATLSDTIGNKQIITILFNQNNKLPLASSFNQNVRISFYAKSTEADLLSIYHGDKVYAIQIDSTLKKYVIYLEQNGRQINTKSPVLQFAKQFIDTFGGGFQQINGSALIANLKVWKGGVPCTLDLDFNQIKESSTTIQNDSIGDGLIRTIDLINFQTSKSWSQTFTGDGITTIFSFNHGLWFQPVVLTGSPMSTAGMGNYCLYADSTKIYVKYQTAPAAGVFYFGVRASK